MQKSLIASVFILLILLIFSLSNTEPLEIRFFEDFTILPTFFVLIVISLGIIIGLTIALPMILSKNNKIEKLNQELQSIKQQLREDIEDDTEQKKTADKE